MPSTFEHVSGNPLFGVTRDGDKSLKLIETERGSIAPRVIARSRQGECAAHQPDGNATVVPLDRAVSHGDSLAKHAAARRKQSRSWRNRTCSRALSPARVRAAVHSPRGTAHGLGYPVTWRSALQDDRTR